MKELTNIELDNAPEIIKYIYINGWKAILDDKNSLDVAFEKYPEYFKDEIEYQNKYLLIPENIHYLFYKEIKELVSKNICDSYLGNKIKELRLKYYSKYGIE